MLLSLGLRNVALIEELEIQFHKGFHVLSGETGAGKSIVVDAVNLALGGRADREIIRTGTEKARVEAVFDVPGDEGVAALLKREEIEYDGRTVTICREVSQNGRNLCRICGVMMPVGFLREMAPLLMDIHGQHEHQFLMNPEMHLSFLDRMGGEDHRSLLDRTRGACERFMEIHRKYARLVRENEKKKSRIEQLEKELEELHGAKLREGEEEELEQEAGRLRNAQKIRDTLEEAHLMLATGEREASCMEKIRAASGRLKALAPYGGRMEEMAERCESLYYELEELSFEISQAADQSDAQPGRLEAVENRMDLIRRLQRKYGETIREILQEQEKMEKEYSELCALDDQISQTGAEHKQALAEYRALARELSRSRRELAVTFEQRMKEELGQLGMGATIFRASFAEAPKKPTMPQPNGDDQMEFLISPNPGEPLKPLAKIASGGELSRLMLAIKSLEAGHRGVEAMVFDEIDTGISGRMAQVVAEKMRRIAGERQVICVTHLPQIAAAAEYQYLVHKDVVGQRTVTSVQELDRSGRIEEVARMISGAQGITAEAAGYAEKMISAYEQ